MEFQNRLYELRKKAGLSQGGAGRPAGVTRQAVQKWEAGSSRPDMDNLAALARYFNVSLDYLVTGREPEPYAQEVPTTIINHNYYPRWHYEYKSQRTLFGLPLVHVRLGIGASAWPRDLRRGQRGGWALRPGRHLPGTVQLGRGSPWACCWPWAGCPWAASPLGPVRWDWPPWAGAIGLLSVGGGSFGAYAVGGGAVGTQIAIGGSASAPGHREPGRLRRSHLRPWGRPAAVTAAIRQAAAAAPVWLQDLLISPPWESDPCFSPAPVVSWSQIYRAGQPLPGDRSGL